MVLRHNMDWFHRCLPVGFAAGVVLVAGCRSGRQPGGAVTIIQDVKWEEFISRWYPGWKPSAAPPPNGQDRAAAPLSPPATTAASVPTSDQDGGEVTAPAATEDIELVPVDPNKDP